MRSVLPTFFGDIGDDSNTDFPDILECPPLDYDYLFGGDFIAASASVHDDRSYLFDDVKEPVQEVVSNAKIADQQVVSIVPPNRKCGKGKSMTIVKDVPIPKEEIKNEHCKRKAEISSSDGKDEAFWESKLESTRQRLHEAYRSEQKKRRTCKFIDLEDCPKPPFSDHGHRAAPRWSSSYDRSSRR